MNGIRSRVGMLVAGAVGLSLVFVAPSASAADDVAAVPTPQVVSQTTNAMLQPGDVPAALGSGSGITTGYRMPPGGQDPMPLCYGQGDRRPIPALDDAIGHFSTSNQVTEEVYVYPSTAETQAAWSVLDRQITRQCSFTTGTGRDRIRARQGELADGSGRWVRMDLSRPDSSAFYSVVGLVDNGIVITRFEGKQGLRHTSDAQRTATDELFGVLTSRYANRTTLEPLQPAQITSAQMNLLQPGDMPAELPTLQPANGAWADQQAKLPGNWPFNSCAPTKDFLPGGTGYYSQSLGSTGDIFMKTGMVYQQVLTYESAESAQAAWNRLNRTIKDCDEAVGKLYAKGSNRKTVTGSVDIGTMPGLFVRETDTENYEGGSTFVNKSYTVYTVSGNTIMSVDYGRSKMGLKRFTINESAIRQLTATAIEKWNPAAM